MDSVVETKVNETEETLQLSNETKENDQENIMESIDNEKAIEKSGEDAVEKTDDQTETKTTTTVALTKEDNGEEGSQTDTQTTITTVIVSKKGAEEDESSVTETKTTTKTVVVTKKDGEEEEEEEKEETTTVFVSKKDGNVSEIVAGKESEVTAEKVSEVVTEKVSEGNMDSDQRPIEKPKEEPALKSITEPNVSAIEKNVEDEGDEGEEEESEQSESSDEEEDLETEAKKEEVEEEQAATKITEKTEVAVESKIEPEKVYNTNKQINNQIENIISDIDINIKAQEKITHLKEQELLLIQKQKELANQIQQQQILAQQLIAQNQLKEQELQAQQFLQQKQFQIQNQYKSEPAPTVSQDYAPNYIQQEDSNIKKESSNITRTVDLRKIFTPATDAPQILPKNRKLYASSAFYSPTLHPTVEDQVELARRISHSLSDISNQTSKGQSMYVNRKKRSVKWVHEASGQEEDDIIETRSLCKENAEDNAKPELTKLEKMPLKLVMNPRGQMRDYNSQKESINVESGLLSPDNCAELITALQLQKGRGAELFAKRRRKAENWVVDETNAGTHSPSGIPDYQQYQARPATSPSILPAYSDAGKHRVQLNLHQDQLIEKYSKPGVQVVKSPWEAALQTGSASTAFLEQPKYRSQTPIASQPSPVHFNQDAVDYSSSLPKDPYKNSFDTRVQSQPIQQPYNPQRELAYKPSVAQGWGGRNVELPREYYCEILQQESEQFNFDEINKYLFDEQLLVDTKPYGNNTHFNHFTNTSNLNYNCNEEIQQRLRQLEQFQQLFMQQQLHNQNANLNLKHRNVKPVERYQQNISVDKCNTTVCEAIQEECKDEKDKTESNAEISEPVNVRELIFSFEQQSLKEPELPQKQCYELSTDKKRLLENDLKFEGSFQPKSESSQIDESTNKGLYVPKEISLSSYAPPPVQSGVQQSTRNFRGSTNFDYSKGYDAPTGLPVSNASPGLYSSSAPPKQQLYSNASYQKVPPSSVQAAPQVNFNPSPLSFDKLSKFQEPEQRNSGIPNQRYLNACKQPAYGGARNASPTPFMSGSFEDRPCYNHTSRLPISSNAPYSSGSHQVKSQGQSFNNCARGWSTGPSIRQNAYSPRVPIATESLPYSDF